MTMLGKCELWKNGCFPRSLYIQWQMIFAFRYFQRIQPFKSMVYDCGMGIWNGLNPVKTFKEGWSVMRKIFHRKGNVKCP